MQIPLNQFEQYIDETILKRGLSYFKNGYVSIPEEITQGVYEAIVSGSEDYTVELKIKNNTVEEYVCTCPYDLGPVCKHVVAVIFYIQKDVLELNQKIVPLHKPKEKTSTKNAKKKTISEQINEVLEKITHDELKQFVREKTEYNMPFRNIFLSSFAHQNSNESKDIYAKQIKFILRTAVGREGFIYRNQTGSVGKQVNELVYAAQKHVENKNFKSAIFICTAVMEEMTAALQFADDSNGDIGGHIDFAFELLFDIAKEKLPEETRILLFEYCLSAFKKRFFFDWDWHLGVLNIASEILNNEEEAQRILVFIDKVHHSEYEKEEAQRIKFNIIKNTKGEIEADKFIEQNISNPILRRESILKSIHQKNYEKALSLAKDGIKHDEIDRPGLAKEWYDWLLKVAQAQNDKEKIVEYARFLFVDNYRYEQDYYQLLKNNVEQKYWNNFVEEIIKEITLKKRWLDFDLIANIFIKEQWWNRLLELVKMNPSLSYIEQHEKVLSKDYADELVFIYEKEIINYIKKNAGRNHYKTACKYLRRMIKLGGRETVEKMVFDFRMLYPHRIALMDELNRV